MHYQFNEPSGESKTTFTLTVNDGKREVIVAGEMPMHATLREDNYYNTLRLLEQALYNAFYRPTPTPKAQHDMGSNPVGSGNEIPSNEAVQGSS